MTYKEEFITFMVRSGVLTFGDFTTKSGRKTPYFVNTGNYKTGAQAAKLGDYYAACIQEHMPEGITCLFGPTQRSTVARGHHLPVRPRLQGHPPGGVRRRLPVPELWPGPALLL